MGMQTHPAIRTSASNRVRGTQIAADPDGLREALDVRDIIGLRGEFVSTVCANSISIKFEGNRYETDRG